MIPRQDESLAMTVIPSVTVMARRPARWSVWGKNTQYRKDHDSWWVQRNSVAYLRSPVWSCNLCAL